jgi:hypothetical protein
VAILLAARQRAHQLPERSAAQAGN